MDMATPQNRYKAAVTQMYAAIEQYFYPDGETLRASIPAELRSKLSEFLGHELEECPKESVLQQARFMAKHMDDFFQDFSRAVVAGGGTIPFYSDIDARLAVTRRSAAPEKPVNYKGLARGLHGDTPDPMRLMALAQMSPEMAESHAALLAERTAAIIADTRRAQKVETRPPSPMEQAWEENGQRALERQEDPSHTRAAIEAIREGRYDQFRRATTPEAIREARAANADKPRGV